MLVNSEKSVGEVQGVSVKLTWLVNSASKISKVYYRRKVNMFEMVVKEIC